MWWALVVGRVRVVGREGWGEGGEGLGNPLLLPGQLGPLGRYPEAAEPLAVCVLKWPWPCLSSPGLPWISHPLVPLTCV